MKKFMVLFMMVAMVMGFSMVTLAGDNGENENDGWIGGSVTEDGWFGYSEDEECTLCEELDLDLELKIKAEIGPYAEGRVTRYTSFFAKDQAVMEEAILSGRPGIYTNDGNIFGNMMGSIYDEAVMRLGGDSSFETEENLATIEIRTNSPIFIDWEFDNDGWLQAIDNDGNVHHVDTILGIHDRSRPLQVEDSEGEYAAADGFSDFKYNRSKVANLFPEVTNLGGYVGVFGQSTHSSLTALSNSTSILQNFQYCTTREYELKLGIVLEKVTAVRAGEYEGTVNVTISDLGEKV